jgi:translocation and assembly module TamB
LQLGENVHFRGFNLSGDLRGNLTLLSSNSSPMKLAGEVRIEQGYYKLYGVDLDITKGQIIYARNTVDNPALDLRAVREIRDEGTAVTAGITAIGRLKTPEIELFSEPAMQESEILSYLILGRPLGSATASEGDLLLSALTALSVEQGLRIAKVMAQTFGFDEARINRSGLVLSKSLSPRFRINYEIGIANPTNALELRYKINKNWTVRTETSDENIADIMYETER